LDDRGVVVASIDTDGIDGSTDAAGAIVDSETVPDPDEGKAALARNDAYPFLDERNALLRTGETGTNVNDLRVLVVDGQ
jgi:hydroxypyruvate reductase